MPRRRPGPLSLPVALALAAAGCLGLLVGGIAGAAGPAGEPEQAGLERARQLAQRGDARAAALAYDQVWRVARAAPATAPLALFEAALLHQEQLGDPARARGLLQRLIADFPRHRLAARASARLAHLEPRSEAGTEARALARYHEILEGYAGRPRDSSRQLMRLLLAEHPHFGERDRALLWLAGELDRDGQPAAAEQSYQSALEAAQRHGGARLQAASLALERAWRAHREQRQLRLRTGLAAAFLLLFTLGSALGARPWRAPHPPWWPFELRYYLPVAALLVLVGWLGAGSGAGRALAVFACGGAGVVHVNALLTWRLARTLSPGRIRGSWTALQLGLIGLATLALLQLAVVAGRLRL